MNPLGHQHAVVTGASSGLGLAIATALLASKVRVTALSRRPPPIKDPACHHLEVDLCDDSALADAWKHLQNDLPDLWINNAGFGLLGELETTKLADGDRLLKLLLHVPIACTHWYACQLRACGPENDPCLVQVSSLACELPIPLMPWYNTAKAGLSAFSSSLLLDATVPFRVIDFRPGDFNTPFIEQAGMVTASPTLKSYQQTLARQHAQAPPAEKAAADLLKALRRRRNGIIRTGSFFQRAIAPLGPRIFSQAFLRRLIRRYYDLPKQSKGQVRL
jgi:short-subunit dehydrogenase